jgi:hypothetical protein
VGGARELASCPAGRSNLSPVRAAVVDLALRRPWALIAANLVALAALAAVAVTGANGLPIGSLAPSGSQPAEPDLIVATEGQVPVDSGVYRVALRVISSQVQADDAVSEMRRGPVSSDGRSTSLLVALEGADEFERQDAVERIQAAIDPGPLRVTYGGEAAALLDARHELAGGFWKLELLALPFVALVLALALGPRLALAPVIAAATGIVGALTGLVVIDSFADMSLLGIAPAAVVGLVLGVEAPSALFARYRAELTAWPREEALRRAVGAAADLAIPVWAAASLVTVGLVATSLDQAPSMIVGCALAAALALSSALLVAPAAISVDAHAREEDEAPVASWLARRPAGAMARLAASRGWTVAWVAFTAGVMVAAAASLVDAQADPFSALDLPGDSPSRVAAVTAGLGEEGGGGNALFGDLPLTAGLAAVALGLVSWVAFRDRRSVPVALVSLLPAAAACGLCVLVFQDGHLAAALSQTKQGALETGATAALLTGLVSISAARSVTVMRAAADGRTLSLDPGRNARLAGSLLLPATIIASLTGAAAAGVLAGASLYAAREFGLAVAAGLLIDVALLRPALIAALARWSGG